ncbi:MAG: hypothetical protein RLZZ200_1618, partial [Pseudomonadota bacterium]
ALQLFLISTAKPGMPTEAPETQLLAPMVWRTA